LSTSSPSADGVVIARPSVVSQARAPQSMPHTAAAPASPHPGHTSPRVPAPTAPSIAPAAVAPAASRTGAPTSSPTKRPVVNPARETRETPSDSIFGEDLISEKSLDEVILAYLAEDAKHPK
jgi:hypothetical protein